MGQMAYEGPTFSVYKLRDTVAKYTDTRMQALVVFALAGVVHAALPNCRAPGAYTVGGVTQCDISTECDWCSRNHLSFDFLCCETGKWLGPHLTNPLLLYLMWNNVTWTVLLVLAFELFEVVSLAIAGSSVPLFADERDFETIAAAFIGDVAIQGGLGLFIGWLLRSLFRVPTLVSSVERAVAYDLRGRRALYIVLYVLVLTSYAVCGVTIGANAERIGLMLQLAFQLIFIWFVWPVALNNTESDRELIWRVDRSTVYGGPKKTLFFGLWGITVIAAYVPHFAASANQPVWSINEWYMQWSVTAVWALVLALVTLMVSVARTDWYTVGILTGSMLVASGFVCLFAYAITAPGTTTLVIWGAVLLVVGIIVWLVTATATDYEASAAAITRRQSFTTFVEYTEQKPLLTPAAAAYASYRSAGTGHMRQRHGHRDIEW